MLSVLSSQSWVFISTERSLRCENLKSLKKFPYIIAIGINGSCSNSVCQLNNMLYVFRDNTSSQSVVRVISSLYNFFNCVEFNNRHNWAEDFFSSDFHVIFDISKDSWVNEIPLSFILVSTSYQFGSVLFSMLNVR